MKLIFCLDDKCGIAFNNRRQSRDRAMCEDIVRTCAAQTLAMSEYSAKLFPECDGIRISDAPTGDGWYFLELVSPAPYMECADTVVIYRWNRHYPSDVSFNTDPCELGFTLSEVSELVGSSHDKITKEVYTK